MNRRPSRKSQLHIHPITTRTPTLETFVETEKLLHQTVELLQKPPSERLPHDNKEIANFLKDFSSLQMLLKPFEDPQQKLLQISSCAQLQHFWTGEAIFNKGDFSDRVYVILKGSAVVYTEIAAESAEGQAATLLDTSLEGNVIEHETAPEEPKTVTIPLKRGLTQLFKPKMERHTLKRQTTLGNLRGPGQTTFCEQDPPVKEQIEDAMQTDETKRRRNLQEMSAEYQLLVKANSRNSGKFIKHGQFTYKPKLKVPQGSFFGEVGLLMDNLRVWTLIAGEETYVLTLSKEDYFAIFQERLDYLKKYNGFIRPFFQDIPYSKLMQLTSFLEEWQFPNNAIIFEENQEVDGFYLIREGQVQLEKQFQPIILTKTNDARSSPKLKPKQKFMLAKINEGEALGEIDFFFNSKRDYTARVTSTTATFLKFKLDIFQELHPSYQALFEELKKASFIKMQVRQDKMKQEIIKEALLEEAREARSPTFEEKSPTFQKLPKISNTQVYTKRSESPQRPNLNTLASESVYERVKAQQLSAKEQKPKGAVSAGILTGQENYENFKQVFLDLLPEKEVKKVIHRENLRKRAELFWRRKQTQSKERESIFDEEDVKKVPKHQLYLNKLQTTKNIYNRRSMFYKPDFEDSESLILPHVSKYPMLKLKHESVVQVKPLNPSPKHFVARKMRKLINRQKAEEDDESIGESMFIKDILKLKINPPPTKEYIIEGNFLNAEKKQMTLNSITINHSGENSHFLISDMHRGNDTSSFIASSDVNLKSVDRIDRIKKEYKKNVSIVNQDHSGRSWGWPKHHDYEDEFKNSIGSIGGIVGERIGKPR